MVETLVRVRGEGGFIFRFPAKHCVCTMYNVHADIILEQEERLRPLLIKGEKICERV